MNKLATLSLIALTFGACGSDLNEPIDNEDRADEASQKCKWFATAFDVNSAGGFTDVASDTLRTHEATLTSKQPTSSAVVNASESITLKVPAGQSIRVSIDGLATADDLNSQNEDLMGFKLKLVTKTTGGSALSDKFFFGNDNISHDWFSSLDLNSDTQEVTLGTYNCDSDEITAPFVMDDTIYNFGDLSEGYTVVVMPLYFGKERAGTEEEHSYSVSYQTY